MSIPEISAKEAASRIKQDPAVKLLDVRTDEEYETARIPGAILVNTPQHTAQILALPKETPIIVHCHHGMRSLRAAQWLLKQGFKNVSNLAGGIDAWSTDVDPRIPRY